jgi:hypothetical protein
MEHALSHPPDMHLREYLDRAVQECERGILLLDGQLKIDRDYVGSSEADPTDVEFYRCQIEINIPERECLQKKLIILKIWIADPRSRASDLARP